MRLPRMRRISPGDLASRSSPSKCIEPLTMWAAVGSSRKMESASVVLPEPDSPTMPSVSPARSVERDLVDRLHRAGSPTRDVVGRQLVELQERAIAHSWRSCGSSFTRSQSPSRLAARTISTMHTPGNTVSHQ